MEKIAKEQAVSWFKKLGRTKKVIKVGKIGDKYDIFTVEEKRIVLIGNRTKRILEMTSRQRELDEIRLKTYKMRFRRQIEK